MCVYKCICVYIHKNGKKKIKGKLSPKKEEISGGKTHTHTHRNLFDIF